ncbi:hypothetical protein DFJ43DRAFT_1158633 [Lentinula guzmanii]|uniref:Zn(2)-C6 fungal-type domain-containing protein n=1 Tax=Lentinula guzmanii TaxID=2804957 RepID=A0AA38MWG7_9AGAR|nr:hypothetical protein DFJ43DRAFT_1158633 [Lentinula guzmanii]
MPLAGMSPLKIQFYEPSPSEASSFQSQAPGMYLSFPVLEFVVSSSVFLSDFNAEPPRIRRAGRACDHCKFIKVRCIKPDESTYCKRCLDDNIDCIISKPRQRKRPPGPKRGAQKGRKASNYPAFNEERNWSASNFDIGHPEAHVSTQPVERSMPDSTTMSPPNPTSTIDQGHYDMEYNAASMSSYSYGQSHDNYTQYAEPSYSNITDSWALEGNGNQPEASDEHSYPIYHSWDGPFTMHMPAQPYAHNNNFRQYWNHSYYANI